jgi:DNA helicase IV
MIKLRENAEQKRRESGIESNVVFTPQMESFRDEMIKKAGIQVEKVESKIVELKDEEDETNEDVFQEKDEEDETNEDVFQEKDDEDETNEDMFQDVEDNIETIGDFEESVPIRAHRTVDVKGEDLSTL